MTEAVEKQSNPLKIDIFYGLGTLGNSAIGFVVSSWLLYFYIPPDGLPLIPIALYGVAVLFGRLVGAISTPVVGYLSDNSQNRWGRRLPFMFRSAFLLVAYFYLLWVPPRPAESIWNLAYLMIIMIAFRTTLAFYRVPYQALLPEIALTERHRVRISALQSGFLLIGMLLGGLAGPLIEDYGYPKSALLYGAFAMLIFYLPFLVLRERSGRTIALEERIAFRHSLSLTLQNRAFMLFAVVFAAYLMTSSFVQSSAPFIVTEVCQLNKADTIYFYMPGIFASLLCYPLIVWLARRWGKGKVYAGSLLASAFIFPGTMLIGEWFPVSLKIQCSSWAALQSVAISGVVVLSSAFVAEITDYDRTLTGQHREGMYFAAMGLLEQLFAGIASVLLPLVLLLGRSQTSPQGPLGVRMTGLLGGGFMLFAFFMFLRYPLRHQAVQAEHSVTSNG